MKSPKPKAAASSQTASPSQLSSALYGIGVDVLRTERMEEMFERRGKSLLPRLLMPAELREVRTRTQTARALTMCWAAKEAFAKAYGTGFRGFGWRDVGVVRETNGRPVLIFSRRLKALLKDNGVGAAHLSLSDDGGVVCAYVVLERAR